MIPDEVKKIIRDVGLEDKADKLTQDLSYGQKRKLSVAISFLGNNKIVFLDEPTSGMDVNSRRNIWELIIKNK